MGMRTALVGVSVLGMMAFGRADSPTWVTAEVPNAQPARPASAGAHAPESLTVRFYAKVYLLPSADSPLLGVIEDGGRLPLYRIKDGWSQIGFRNSTGWIQAGRKASRGRWAGLGTAAAKVLPPFLSMPVACTAAAGSLMLAILAGVLWIASRRRRAKPASVHPGGMERPQVADNGAPCSLEGRIIAHGLAEILQFLELGRRTGMLSVDDGHPAGVINFDQGRITFAHTRQCEGMDAVLEILAIGDGTFHFFEGKQVRQTNCRLSALEVLLHNAQRMDELRNRMYSTGT